MNLFKVPDQEHVDLAWVVLLTGLLICVFVLLWKCLHQEWREATKAFKYPTWAVLPWLCLIVIVTLTCLFQKHYEFVKAQSFKLHGHAQQSISRSAFFSVERSQSQSMCNMLHSYIAFNVITVVSRAVKHLAASSKNFFFVQSETHVLVFEVIILLEWMPPQSDFWWQRNIQVNYSTWSINLLRHLDFRVTTHSRSIDLALILSLTQWLNYPFLRFFFTSDIRRTRFACWK